VKKSHILDLIVGPLEVNCYVIGCTETKQAAIVDPGAETEKIIQLVVDSGLCPTMIINTHGHLDHVAGNADIAEHFDIPVCLHGEDLFLLNSEDIFGLAESLNARPCPEPKRQLFDNDVLEVGNLKIRVIHTPGHTPGSCCLGVDDVCLSGDTLFAGSVGRTDLRGGNYGVLLRSLREKIMPLPDRLTLLPGHGPATTIGREKITNPFLQGLS